MSDITKRFAAFSAACALLTACGGGAGVSTPSSNLTPTSPNGSQSARATFVVKVPAKANSPSSRRPAYITSNVQGIDFTVTQTGQYAPAYVFYALTPQSTYCSSSSSGLTCNLQVDAPPGNDTFVVKLYDSTKTGTAYVVATGNVTATIAAQQSNTISVTTDGVPAFATVGISNPYPASGTAQTIPLTVQATDADGNIIVGSFDQPIVLATTDTTGAITFSKSSLSQPSDLNGLTLIYNGATMASHQSVYVVSTSGTLGGTPANIQTDPQLSAKMPFYAGFAGAIASPGALYFAHPNSAPQTITVAGANGSIGPFTTDTACSAYVTITGTSPNFTVTPAATTFDPAIPAFAMGHCEFNVYDHGGNSTPVSVIVGQ